MGDRTLPQGTGVPPQRQCLLLVATDVVVESARSIVPASSSGSSLDANGEFWQSPTGIDPLEVGQSRRRRRCRTRLLYREESECLGQGRSSQKYPARQVFQGRQCDTVHGRYGRHAGECTKVSTRRNPTRGEFRNG